MLTLSLRTAASTRNGVKPYSRDFHTSRREGCEKNHPVYMQPALFLVGCLPQVKLELII